MADQSLINAQAANAANAPSQMTPDQFGQHIKSVHPEYESLDNTELTNKVLAKYPQYQSHVTGQNFKQNVGPKPPVQLAPKPPDSAVGRLLQPVKDFASSAANTLGIPTDHPSDILTGPALAVAHPSLLGQSLVNQGKGLLASHVDTAKKGYGEMTSPTSDIPTRIKGVARMGLSALPGVGPMLSNAADTGAEGNLPAAAGAISTLALPKAMEEAPKLNLPNPKEALQNKVYKELPGPANGRDQPIPTLTKGAHAATGLLPSVLGTEGGPSLLRGLAGAPEKGDIRNPGPYMKIPGRVPAEKATPLAAKPPEPAGYTGSTGVGLGGPSRIPMTPERVAPPVYTGSTGVGTGGISRIPITPPPAPPLEPPNYTGSTGTGQGGRSLIPTTPTRAPNLPPPSFTRSIGTGTIGTKPLVGAKGAPLTVGGNESVARPSRSMVLTPQEAAAEAQMQILAKRRASERGMQFAGGMVPREGRKVPQTPTKFNSTEYPAPRESTNMDEMLKRRASALPKPGQKE